MFEFQENPVLAILTVVLGTGIFGASIWVVLPRESSPFRYGVLRGLGICAGFKGVVFILEAVLVLLLGYYGEVLAVILFYLGMYRIFDAGWRDSFLIVAVNVLFDVLLHITLFKLFVDGGPG